jgi:hypothetical protein
LRLLRILAATQFFGVLDELPRAAESLIADR